MEKNGNEGLGKRMEGGMRFTAESKITFKQGGIIEKVGKIHQC